MSLFMLVTAIVSSGSRAAIAGTEVALSPAALLKLDDEARERFEKANPGVLPEGPLRTRLPFASAKSFNWYTLNEDFYVHSQSATLSCWANTGIEALECNWLIRNGVRHFLSPQPVLDYTQRPNGGNSGIAFDVLLKHGTALMGNYPFTGRPGDVQTRIRTPYRAIAWGRVGDGRRPPTTDQVKSALLEHGPLSVNLFSTRAFHKYPGGVFAEHYHPAKGKPATNHEVLLLGWDNGRGRGAWYIKNSWGEKWGERGYCWIEYGCNNICYHVFWVRAQSIYYVLPKDELIRLVPDAAPPEVWTSPNAPIAKVKAVRVEHNVLREEKKGLIFHVSVEIRRGKGKKALVAVYPMDKDGTFLLAPAGDKTYASKDGRLRTKRTVIPPDDDSTFDDVGLFLPYTQLPNHEGRDDYRYQAFVYCEGKWLSMDRPFRGSFRVEHHGQ